MTRFRLNSGLAPLLVALLTVTGCATQSRLDTSATDTESGMAVANSPLGAELALVDESAPPVDESIAAVAPAPEGAVAPDAATADAAPSDTTAPPEMLATSAAAPTGDEVVTVTLGEPAPAAETLAATPAAAPAQEPEPPLVIEKPLYQGPIPYTSEIAQSIVNSSVSVWKSQSGSYTYYIGEKLIAEYFEGKGALTIRPDDAGASGLSCAWDRNNTLKTDAPKGSARDAARECDRLTRELVTALGTTHNPGPTPEEIAAAEAKAAAEAAAKAEAAAAKTKTTTIETAKPAPPPPAPAPLPTVVEVAKSRMTEHNLALWQSKSKTYNFFVGGVLDAEYAPGNETLTITTGGSGVTSLTCKYDADNSLWVRVDKNSIVDNPEATCDKLVNELAGKLQR